MAPSKKRTLPDSRGVYTPSCRNCPCLTRPQSNGVCEFHVWQGTLIDAQPDQRLLRPNLPVVKYKEFTCEGLTGGMYYLILLSWMPLLALFIAVYFAIVGLYALLFAWCEVDDNWSIPAHPRDYFNLSLQTMATIGYGKLYPRDTCSNWVAMFESFLAMIVLSLMTGVAFVKFARPRSHVIFSRVFTVSPRENSGLEMRFRIVNATVRDLVSQGEILDVSFKLILMRVERTNDGKKTLCYYDLRLKTSSFITLRLEAEIIHYVDSASPFYLMDAEAIEKSDFVLILMMSGVDENLHDMIHQQVEYTHLDMRWGAKFVPMIKWEKGGQQNIILDFELISATLAAPIGSFTNYLSSDVDDHSIGRIEAQDNGNVPIDVGNLAGVESDLNMSQFERKRDWSNSQSSSMMDDDDLLSINMEEAAINQDITSPQSTHTNSGSENGEVTVQRRTLFDQSQRSTSFRLPHITHSRTESYRARHHLHHEQSASMMRKRVRFRNHPFGRFSKGIYYRALETSWIQLFLWLAVLYFSAIAFIALLMHFSYRDALLETSPVHISSQYERVFFFCAQTISTIGYGVLSPNPKSDVVNFYVSILAITGVVVSTLLTGLAWAKFSIPNASTIIFSDNLILTAFHTHRALMFRAANHRTYGKIIEGTFRVSVVILKDQVGRKETHELQLVRNVWPIAQLSSTVVHIIDSNSPLYTFSTDEILSGSLFFIVLFTGLDSVIGENMFSRKTYHHFDILVGHHFVDNIKLASDGLHIDLEAINETVLTPEIDLRESRLYTANTPDDEQEKETAVNDRNERTPPIFSSPVNEPVYKEEINAPSPQGTYALMRVSEF